MSFQDFEEFQKFSIRPIDSPTIDYNMQLTSTPGQFLPESLDIE